MLILTRKPGESLYIGDHIKVIIVEIKGNQIRVGIEAPSDVRIYREEIYLQILEENKNAAEAGPVEALAGLSEAWKDIGGSAKNAPSGARSLMSGAKPAGLPQPGNTGGVGVKPPVSIKRKKGPKDSDE
jgi:carbon storage regulator